MINIRVFDCLTAKIMADLYEKFPIKQDYTLWNFDKEVCMQYVSADRSKRLDVLKGTFTFLEENGLITFNENSGVENGFFYETGLTLEGLKLLNKEPKSIKTTEKIGDLLVKTIKDKGLDMAGGIVEKGLWGLLA